MTDLRDGRRWRCRPTPRPRDSERLDVGDLVRSAAVLVGVLRHAREVVVALIKLTNALNSKCTVNRYSLNPPLRRQERSGDGGGIFLAAQPVAAYFLGPFRPPWGRTAVNI